MTGRMIISYFGREQEYIAADRRLAAIERVVRERLSAGLTMYLSADGGESGRAHMTIMLTPQTHALFTYTDLPGHPDRDHTLADAVAVLRRQVDLYGGIHLDADDEPVDPVI